jgi:hypothetical protein
LTKKEELNTLPNTGRKRQQINPRDNSWPIRARTTSAIEAWFKDLAGSEPLSSLSKKVGSNVKTVIPLYYNFGFGEYAVVILTASAV